MTSSLKAHSNSEFPWQQLDPNVRDNMVWWLWAITYIGSIGAYLPDILPPLVEYMQWEGKWLDQIPSRKAWWDYIVYFSAFHAFLALHMFHWKIYPFPVQVRIVYFFLVLFGSTIPQLEFLMHETFVGNGANLMFGYCPLARIMSLLPWNHTETFSIKFLVTTIFSSPCTLRERSNPIDFETFKTKRI